MAQTRTRRIAALLHDAIEDGVPTKAAKTAVASFGRNVYRIVKGCTDAEAHPKPGWRPRKDAYLARIATEGRSVLLVSAFDKLHNARSIVRDMRDGRENLWGSFNAAKDDVLWSCRSLVTAYKANDKHYQRLIARTRPNGRGDGGLGAVVCDPACQPSWHGSGVDSAHHVGRATYQDAG